MTSTSSFTALFTALPLCVWKIIHVKCWKLPLRGKEQWNPRSQIQKCMITESHISNSRIPVISLQGEIHCTWFVTLLSSLGMHVLPLFWRLCEPICSKHEGESLSQIFSFASAYLGEGQGGGSLSRDAQTTPINYMASFELDKGN